MIDPQLLKEFSESRVISSTQTEVVGGNPATAPCWENTKSFLGHEAQGGTNGCELKILYKIAVLENGITIWGVDFNESISDLVIVHTVPKETHFFRIERTVTQTQTVEVEADSRDEARRIAEDLELDWSSTFCASFNTILD